MTGLRFNFNRPVTPESPLFERQITNDEYHELQQCRQQMEQLHIRIQRLEKINLDLELRLEDQAKQNMSLETECIAIDRQWKQKAEILDQEIAKWKMAYDGEQVKGNRLREQLSRTEKELYGILQRKYELMRGPGTTAGGAAGVAGAGSSGGGPASGGKRDTLLKYAEQGEGSSGHYLSPFKVSYFLFTSKASSSY